MSPQIQVLQIGKYYPPYMGGMETHLELLSRKLAETYGVHVMVASHNGHAREEMLEGVSLTRNRTWFHLAGAPICPGMSHRIRASSADLIHLHHPNPAGTISYLRSGHKAPLVVTYHSDIIRQKFMGRMFLPILYRALDRASLILASSPNYIESSPVLAKYKSRCRVVPFGINTSLLESTPEQQIQNVRSKFGPRIVLGVGRFIYYKGFEYLIEAMKEVDATLILIGVGPLRKQLEERARQCGVGSRVIFTGAVDPSEMGAYYQAADVFVLPSIARSEAFGIVQLEAMACGKPVVNTALDSGVPWVSQDGKTGITVPPKNSLSLSAALNRLFENDELRLKMGENARTRLREQFTLDVMVNRIKEAYEEARSHNLNR